MAPIRVPTDSDISQHSSDDEPKTSFVIRERCTEPENKPVWKRFITSQKWIPRWCRQDPAREFGLTTTLMVLCSWSSAVTAANLFYTYPVLNKAAESFNVSYQTASQIPQLLQAGYGVGILLLCPLGDVFRLRPVILTLLSITTITWFGLCLTPSFHAFTALSFIAGFANVSPQLLFPLISSIAPPHRRATAISIVLAGMMMGLAVPRVVAGIVTQYTHWRNIYWAALGTQVLTLSAMFLLFPDFPRPQPETKNFLQKYTHVARDIARMTVTKPILAHGCTVTFLINAAHASFWTTLTAHLAGSPRDFGPLQIGLFSLIAVGTTMLIPVYSYLVIERFATYFASTIGLVYAAVSIAVDAYTGNALSIGGPIVQALGIDLGIQIPSVAYRTAVYRELPANRANVIFTACAFLGQLAGTSIGNAVYAAGGWAKVGTFHIALTGATLVVVLARGPKEEGWLGWRGGAGLRLDGGLSVEKGEEGAAVAEAKV
ncbi:major facilitator superfamily domain-containing protein [Cercophora newfieldiana]|uniref:Major facilitator superfamily domain-containing protein n=1 Tax=Cercophora newfieldiana TaxID=92897 RepID=A0AA39YLK5_9PEZI|nr:major facilitator superfamily domain-containing protein [Cercophora newfieldiana]